MKAHVRIEKKVPEPGGFHIVTDDRLIAVGEDGTEVDISRCVIEWREVSKVGEARKLEIRLLGFEEIVVGEHLALVAEEPPQ